MTEQPTTAMEALHAFALQHTDKAAAQALVDEAARELSGRTVVRPDEHLVPRRFVLRRRHDVTGVSGLGDVADGVLWPDGTAAVRWRGEHPSTVHQGATEVVFVDQGDEQPAAAAGPGTVPLVLRRIVEHALRRPVPCPKCARLTPCRCIADRTEGRLDVVLDAVALWLAGSAAA